MQTESCSQSEWLTLRVKMSKRVCLGTSSGSASFLGLGPDWLSMPKDLMKLVYSLLTPDDKCMVKYAHGIISASFRCPMSRNVFNSAIISFSNRCIRQEYWSLVKWIRATYGAEYIHVNLALDKAIGTGNLPVVQWLEFVGSHRSFIGNASCFAVEHGQIPVLQWLETRGFRPNQHVVDTAIREDKVEVLEWLFVNSTTFIWDSARTMYAPDNVRKWAIERGLIKI
jgi:hypothetical protein